MNKLLVAKLGTIGSKASTKALIAVLASTPSLKVIPLCLIFIFKRSTSSSSLLILSYIVYEFKVKFNH